MYEHNVGTDYGTFFDDTTPKEQLLTVVCNAEPVSVKVFEAIEIQSNERWGLPDNDSILIPADENYPRGMQSKIHPQKFALEEGIYRSEYDCNMLTNSDTPTVPDLHDGDRLRGRVLINKLTNDSNDKVVIFSVGINYNP